MSETEKVRRDKQIMVRLSEYEYGRLLGTATAADRKPADMARVLMLRGMRSDLLEHEDNA
jgi:hypothetical protein